MGSEREGAGPRLQILSGSSARSGLVLAVVDLATLQQFPNRHAGPQVSGVLMVALTLVATPTYPSPPTTNCLALLIIPCGLSPVVAMAPDILPTLQRRCTSL